eukprot:TRINITY_DN68787_c0_g1_i1.p1 TRINITY_DN68787_c0_g1~~TRINITY_DN68787_c0_g1_i1.p1  ORF type:complete len:663 (-),score=80.02 TRINITY_DN68787_c0_g1_i1:72-1991(-)
MRVVQSSNSPSGPQSHYVTQLQPTHQPLHQQQSLQQWMSATGSSSENVQGGYRQAVLPMSMPSVTDQMDSFVVSGIGAVDEPPGENPGIALYPPLCSGVVSARPSPCQSSQVVSPQRHNDEPLLSCLRIGKEANSVAVSPDGKRFVVGLQDHTLQLWDMEVQSCIKVLRGHRYWVTQVSYSLDGVHIASASADKTVRVWSAVNGKCEALMSGHMLSVAAVSFSDDATRLAAGSWDKTVSVWEVENGGRLLMTMNGHTDWVHSVAWAPGGRQLASASSDHSVRLWSTITGIVEQVLVGHLQTVTSVHFARNGIFLASGSLDRTVRVWNVQEGTLSSRLQQEGDEGSVHSVAFGVDSERIVIGCSDKSVKVWNFRTGEQEGRYLGHDEAALSVCFFPDGARFVSCSHDKTARVWRMPLGRTQSPASSSPSPTCRGGQAVAKHSVAGSFQELHDRLRISDEMNQQLRQQLTEAQSQIEENNRHMRNRDSSMGQQEQQLTNYRDMITSLTAEKQRLERSFEEMRRELRQLPSSPAGGSGSRPVDSGSGVSGSANMLSALTLGPAGARRGAGSPPASEPQAGPEFSRQGTRRLGPFDVSNRAASPMQVQTIPFSSSSLAGNFGGGTVPFGGVGGSNSPPWVGVP